MPTSTQRLPLDLREALIPLLFLRQPTPNPLKYSTYDSTKILHKKEKISIAKDFALSSTGTGSLHSTSCKVERGYSAGDAGEGDPMIQSEIGLQQQRNRGETTQTRLPNLDHITTILNLRNRRHSGHEERSAKFATRLINRRDGQLLSSSQTRLSLDCRGLPSSMLSSGSTLL